MRHRRYTSPVVRAATIAAMERISTPIARLGRRATGRSRAFARCWLVGCALIATLSSPAGAEAPRELAASLTALGAAYRAYLSLIHISEPTRLLSISYA